MRKLSCCPNQHHPIMFNKCISFFPLHTRVSRNYSLPAVKKSKMDSSGKPYRLKFGNRTMVCDKSQFVGNITFGERCIVHPQARIIAEAGPIIIGDGNLIEEQAEIYNRLPADGCKGTPPTMIIGNNNVFEVASYSESLKIGDSNVLEAKAHVGRNTILGNGCIIGAMCKVTSHETIPDKTVICGRNCTRKVQLEKPPPQTLQLDFLSKLLINYHHTDKGRSSTAHK